jgi:hypothetical protein
MEDQVQGNPSWFKDAAKNGLILGAIHIVVMLLLYVLMPSKLTGFSYVAFILVLNFGYTIYMGNQWRKQVGGFLDYGAAFKYAFILLFINGLTGIIFSALLLIVDPTYPEVMAESQMNTSIYWAQKFGAPEESLEQMREQFDPETMAERYGFKGLLTGLGIGVVFYAIGALIMAIFIRKSQPEMI